MKIEETAQAVRENTATLRVQLAEAQKTLAIRKTYDELANKITSNKSLRPRDEQLLSLEKLRSEIEDLEKEKQQYAQTWVERREQFSRLVEEGHRLRRLIRDEKEEVERREGMEEGDEDESSVRGRSSLVGTPRPDAGQTPLPSGQGSGTGTSRATSPHRHELTTVDGEVSKTPAPEVEDADMVDEGEVDESEDQDRGNVDGEVAEHSERTADAMDTT